MNPGSIEDTHPFAKASLTARAENSQKSFRVYCQDIKNFSSCWFTHYTSTACQNFTLCPCICFGILIGEKNQCVSQNPTNFLQESIPGSAHRMTRVEAGPLGQSRFPAGFGEAWLYKIRGREGPKLQCRFLKVTKVAGLCFTQSVS